jgi:large subunit ribosomal protein L3
MPRFRTWPEVEAIGPIGFYGYKAGMTHALLVDARPKTPTSGQPRFTPITVIETPPLFVYGIRVYRDDPNYGRLTLTEVWAEKLPKYFSRRVAGAKKGHGTDVSKLEELKDKIVDVRLLVATQPWLIKGLGKKTPDVGEIGIGGKSIDEKLDYATSVLGKEIRIKDIFSPGEQIDVKAVTKGHGFEGPVKRFGVFEFGHKKEKTKRGIGAMGPFFGGKVFWEVPRPGQMGFHTRTEYNKIVVIVGENGEPPITPKGGFLHYGEVKNDYIAVIGSVPGPARRVIGLRKAIRPNKHPFQFSQVRYVSLESKQGV